MKTSVVVMLCAGSLILGAGCKTETGALPPVNTTQHDTENRLQFVLMDKGAQRSVTCSGIEQKVLPDGRLEVAANVRNRENRRIQVQVNCEFKDAEGFTVDSTPWQTLILTENGQETVRFTSLNNQAKKFTIRVREAR
ncbi:MAG: YcfL family protein [Verrucomicrobia bacterium]|nr:YcfL family protein [Verrucomicrobiota bacterium]